MYELALKIILQRTYFYYTYFGKGALEVTYIANVKSIYVNKDKNLYLINVRLVQKRW